MVVAERKSFRQAQEAQGQPVQWLEAASARSGDAPMGSSPRGSPLSGKGRRQAQGALMILATRTTKMTRDRPVWNIMIALVGRFRTPSRVGPNVVLVKKATQK